MTVIIHDCPHCRAEMMTHEIKLHDKVGERKGAVYLKCNGCGMPSAALISTSKENKASFQSLIDAKAAPQKFGYIIDEFFPETAEADIPEHLPPRVDDILREAEDAKSRKKKHSAGLAYGKVLDIAFKKFDPTIKGTLHSRIDQLGKSGKLTPELADWAMGLKVVRNDSTHDEEPFEDKDIEEIAEATKLILQYLFTMPERLRLLKSPPAPTTP